MRDVAGRLVAGPLRRVADLTAAVEAFLDHIEPFGVLAEEGAAIPGGDHARRLRLVKK